MNRFIYILAFLFMLSSCVEEIEIDTEVTATSNIEDILVVEATFTNELKQQQVILQRGSSFGGGGLSIVQNASVRLEDNAGNIISFFQSEPGTFLSEISFQAIANTGYTLQIEVDGKTYRSEEVRLPAAASLTNVYAERIVSDTGEDGIGIYVDATVSPDEPPLLRYTYEETYKIIAPLWSPFDMVVLDPNPPFDFGLVPREQEERVCFGTQFSNNIIQNEGFDLVGNTVENALIRFIPGDDFIIAHRYSILVKQMVQSPDAFAFYETLNELASSSSVFTDVQPGFIEGNISNVNDEDEKVLGFFEVANVSERRLFFNYEDFYPPENERAYPIRCTFLSAPATINPGGTSPLKDIIEGGEFIYVRDTNGTVEGGGPYFVARRACGDCTVLGSNIVPEFWIE